MGVIGGILLLIANIWAIIKILGSKYKGMEKLLWIAAVLIFPFFGVAAWYFIKGKDL